MPSVIHTRQDDEQALDWIMRRSRGKSSGEIARADGVTPSRVRTVTNRVRAADEKYCKTDLEGYW